jgi:transposase-like protein
MTETKTSENHAFEILAQEVDKVFSDMPPNRIKLAANALNFLNKNGGNVTEAAKKFKITRPTLTAWVNWFNAKADSAHHVAVKKRNNYSAVFMRKVVDAYNNGTPVGTLSVDFGVPAASIYNWIRVSNNGKPQKRGRKPGVPNSRKPSIPNSLVQRVMQDIEHEYDTEQSHSLATDFTANPAISKPEANTELNFCPCCGTNIKAVRVALETCQEMSSS